PRIAYLPTRYRKPQPPPPARVTLVTQLNTTCLNCSSNMPSPCSRKISRKMTASTPPSLRLLRSLGSSQPKPLWNCTETRLPQKQPPATGKSPKAEKHCCK